MAIFFPLLSLMLIFLKLTHYLKISWVLALAPIWFPYGLALIFLLFYVLICLVLGLVGKK